MAEVKVDYPFYLEQERAFRQVEKEEQRAVSKAVRKEEKTESWNTIALGVGLCGLAAAYAGGLYAAVAWLEWDILDSRKGPLILLGIPIVLLGGVFTLLKGLYHRIRWW